MEPESITVRRWFDRHYHPRDDYRLPIVLPRLLKQRAIGAVIMGNLDAPNETSTIKKTLSFKKQIMSVLPPESDFVPYMTLYLTDEIKPDEVVRGFKEGVWCAVKMYMVDKNKKGGTTGSHAGVTDLIGRYPVFAAMEEHAIPLLGHFEAFEDSVDEFDREIVSVEQHLEPLLKAHPRLPVVFEHITDGRAADFVADASYNIYATVTPQHIMLNRNALFSGGMNPGNYCKPVLKREKHRRRVRKYVTSGHSRFGAGTDSAPHPLKAKSRCYGCAAGIFHVKPVEMYTQVFYEDKALHHLDRFLSQNFLHIYGIKPSEETMTIRYEPQVIPKKIGNIPVFMGGTEIQWTLV